MSQDRPLYDRDGIVLWNRDCLEIMKGIPDGSIDLVCTDPPYRITPKGNAGTMGGHYVNRLTMSGKVFSDNCIECSSYLPEFYRVLKDGTHCYVMTNHVNLVGMLNTAIGCGFRFVKSLIWEKGNKICGRFYMNCFEYILMFRKGSQRQINDCSTPDLLSFPVSKLKGKDGSNLHDTEKPVALMRTLIGNSTDRGETVFEPFAGIGATLLASRELGRKCIGCEIDAGYAGIIVDRLEGRLGQTRQLELF